MTLLKRYVLRLFISLKYITANVVDRNNGRIIATASTVEHALKGSLECGRACNAKAAAVVGEVLAMRLRVDGLEHGQGRGIHVDVRKEIEKKGFQNRTKIWAIVNALNNNGVRNNGRIIATASTVEHALKGSLECGRACNAKAAAVVGEVLAMRLRVDGLEHGQGRGIHVDVRKEIEKKGFQNRTKIWAIVNALNNNGVKLILEDNVAPSSSHRDECRNPRD